MKHKKIGVMLLLLLVAGLFLVSHIGTGTVIEPGWAEEEEAFLRKDRKVKRLGEKRPERGELTVLGSYHEDMVKVLVELFERKSGIRVDYERMPTGDAERKLIAEKDRQTSDIWLGGTVDGHEVLKKMGILVPVKTENEKEFPSRFIDPDGVWKAQYIEVLSIAVNTKKWEEKFQKGNQDYPECPEDLLRPEFKGEIVMPDPVTSGTGYTFLASVLASMGEEKGWKFLSELNKQVGQYTKSGYTPAEKTGLGEYLIGINFLSDQLLVKSFGYPLESRVYEKAGWTPVPVSLTAKGKENPVAKEFMEFCLTKEASDTLVSLGHVLSARKDGEEKTARGNPLKSHMNFGFDPIKEAEAKTARIERFEKMVP